MKHRMLRGRWSCGSLGSGLENLERRLAFSADGVCYGDEPSNVTVTMSVDDQSRLSDGEIRITLGDTDRDGDVDFQDFLTVSANFGKETDAAFAGGDFDGDGGVDFDDFSILASVFGKQLV